MAMSVFLATMAACVVLLANVTAKVVITAPSTVIEQTEMLEIREQGPTAWICAVLVVESPWTAYANIRGYLEGGNAEGKNYTNLVLYPVMELFHTTQTQSRLCVYLPSEDHCFPPAPNTAAVKAVKQLTKRTYFGIRFWGQASNARVQYYKQKLTAALTTYNKAANLDLFFVSYFSDHVREVRYDPASEGGSPRASGLQNDENASISCHPSTSAKEASFSTKTVQAGDDLYTEIGLSMRRLELFDVQKQNLTRWRNEEDCAQEASNRGFVAFANWKNDCFGINFGKEFCSCAGWFKIFVNRKRLGGSEGRWQNPPYSNEELDEIIIYSQVTMYPLRKQIQYRSSATDTANCERGLFSKGHKFTMAAVFYQNKCYLSAFHDVTHCNQTCRGTPGRALIRKDNPYGIVRFLLHCGQTIQVTGTNMLDSTVYISHPGTGCYYYPEAKTPEEENCLITFEKAPTAKRLQVHFDFADLKRASTYVCTDAVITYDGPKKDEASRLGSGCFAGSRAMVIPAKDVVTINFFRNSTSSYVSGVGFKLAVFNVY